jgi:hypothetical protein
MRVTFGAIFLKSFATAFLRASREAGYLGAAAPCEPSANFADGCMSVLSGSASAALATCSASNQRNIRLNADLRFVLLVGVVAMPVSRAGGATV